MEFGKIYQDLDLSLAGIYFYEKEEDAWVDIITLAVDGYTPFDDEVEEDTCGWDKEIADEVMGNLLDEADHYLVFARGCKWDGASGYKFAKNYNEVIERWYEFSLYPISHSDDYKVLVCKEYSHDVPMGSTTIIVALTDEEYEELSNSNFEEVEQFVEEKEKLA